MNLKDKIKQVDVSNLIPYTQNPKKHPDSQIDKIASSIKKFGFTVPILIKGDNEIIAGHGRVEAAKKLGIDEVPAIVRDDLTDAEAKAFRIADNRIAESDWDEDLLEMEFEELEEEFDLTLTGFDEEEIESVGDWDVSTELDPDKPHRDVEMVPLEDIEANTWNPGEMTNRKKTELKRSIRDIGLLEPIVLQKMDEGYRIIDGEHRYDVFADLDREAIPARILKVTDDEAKVLCYTLNRTWSGFSGNKKVELLSDIEGRRSQDFIQEISGISGGSLRNISEPGYEEQDDLKDEGEITMKEYTEDDFEEIKPVIMIEFESVPEAEQVKGELEEIAETKAQAIKELLDSYGS